MELAAVHRELAARSSLLDTVSTSAGSLPLLVETFASSVLPPISHTTAAFVFYLDERRRTLLTLVNKPGRSWDVPGGHRDPGETAHMAAVRELEEETGVVVRPADVTLCGWQRMMSLARPPADYRYPRVGYQAFFVGRYAGDGPQTTPPANSECLAAKWFTSAELNEVCGQSGWHRMWVAVSNEDS